MRKFKKLTMTLVALFAMTAGAWAETETISTASDLWQGAKTFTGTNVTVSVENGGNENGSYVSSIYTMNISVTGDNIITGLVLTIGYNATKAGYMLALPGNCTASGSGSHSTFVTVTDINASSVTMKMDEYAVYVEKVEVTYANPDAPMPVAGQTNQWQFTMPAADVELQVEYYPGMLTFAPNATEGGTVEVVGLTDDGLPAGFEKDAEGNIYVAKGATFTVKATPEEGYHLVSLSDGTNTYQVDNNGMATIIMPDDESDLTLTASFAEDTYNVSFAEDNPEPDKWSAEPNTGLTKGQTVTVTYSGDRKVIGVKAEKKATKLTITIPATANAAALTLDVTGCTTWEQILDQNITLDYEGDGVYGQTSECYILDGNNNRLNLDTPYDPTTNYHWGTQK